MASLMPGVLLKLLQSMDNPDARVVGEHRSAVLQVIGIVPALSSTSGGGGDDLWPSNGFYLQLSDSANSTYVSLSPSDADAVLSSRPQLGQLVHLDRLHFDRPVPRASGLGPIPGGAARPHPFVGSPEPLVARISPSHDGFLIQSSHAGPPPLVPAAARTVLAPKENTPGPAKNPRYSSPAFAKLAGRMSKSAPDRPPNLGKGNSRPSSTAFSKAGSPVPSKCVVPGLVTAKEENRQAAREPGILVPSRYWQPSPVGGKKGAAASSARRRCSGSPLRVADVSEGSSRSVRKSWDDPSSNSLAVNKQKQKSGLENRVDQQAILRTQVAISRRLSNVDSKQTNDEEASTNEKQSPGNNTGSSNPPDKPKIVVRSQKWTDGSIPFDGVSDSLARLGKEALLRRNKASAAAAEALEEALTTESVIRSLSMFSELSSSSKSGNPLPTIERFLSIYDDVVKWNNSNGPNDTVSFDRSKSVHQWVKAALTTDLGVLSLLDETTGCLSNQNNSEKNVVSSSDPPRLSISKRTPAKSHVKAITSFTANSGTKGHGMNESMELVRALRHEMQCWFLKFVEEAVDAVFRLFGDQSNERKGMIYKDNSRVAAVLSHLKWVNDWLDDISRKPREEALMEKIEHLKRKIYGFVISHVESVLDTSVSLLKA